MTSRASRVELNCKGVGGGVKEPEQIRQQQRNTSLSFDPHHFEACTAESFPLMYDVGIHQKQVDESKQPWG